MGLKPQSIVKMNSKHLITTFFYFATTNFLAKDLLMVLHRVESMIQSFCQSLDDVCEVLTKKG